MNKNFYAKLLLAITALLFTAAPFNATASEKDLYDFLWLDPDKKVYVLQNKIYPKTNSFYVDIGYAQNMTGEFQDTTGGQLKAGYFWNEEFAVELNHLQFGSQNNSAYNGIRAVNGAEPFIRRGIKTTSLFLIWSPFYGKINTFNKIFYFDVYFGAGSGSMTMESNLDSVTKKDTKSQFKTETFVPVQFKTGAKLHINRHVHVGIEFMNNNFQAGSAENPNSNKWRQSNDFIFSVGVSF